MNKYDENRITLRLTSESMKNIDEIMKQGKYLNRSELIRDLLWIGLKHFKEGSK